MPRKTSVLLPPPVPTPRPLPGWLALVAIGFGATLLIGRLNPLISSLRDEENIEVLAVSPIESRKQVDVSRLKQRDHRKLTIIDGTLAFVSGRNAGDEYFTGFDEVPIHNHTRHESIPWLDAHMEVSGPLVRHVQETFMRTWARQGGAEITRDRSVLPELEASGSAAGRQADAAEHEQDDCHEEDSLHVTTQRHPHRSCSQAPVGA